ncbi:hypothetical protein DSO57_1013664 [Entomophthora muscae]|uniref:Uncharacterized protein n=1 Tax=Entomophthora muscae TaxID=34485 RepID=A0ACC2U3P6_9FUNG|nr:hypothetical protein DSO57_1013664 [Entomophthora muscae]
MKDGELYVSPLTFEDVKEYSKINYCAKFCTDDRETKRADTTKGLVGHVHEVGRITKTYVSHRIIPTSRVILPTQLSVLSCKYLSSTNLKRAPTYSQLVQFVSNRRQASNPLAKRTTTIKDLVLFNALKKTEDGEMFLLQDNEQEVEDRIIAYTISQNLEQLNTATIWLYNGTFATFPSSLSSFGSSTGLLTPSLHQSVQGCLGCFKLTSCQQSPPPTHATKVNPSSAENDESSQAAEQLAHAHSLEPKAISMDFELAQFRAFVATFNVECQNRRVNPPTRFQLSRFETCNPTSWDPQPNKKVDLNSQNQQH